MRRYIKVKKNKGITMIALVITIIVILILAGVTVNSLIGNDGAIFNAHKSKNQTEIDEEKKILKVSVISAMGNESIANITKDNLVKELNKNIDDKYELEEKDNTDYGNVYEITFKETGNRYTILEDGTILDSDESKNNTGITLTPNVINALLIDGKETIKANIVGNFSDIKWKSSDDTIASIEKNLQDNTKISVVGNAEGTATIEATVQIEKNGKIQTKTAICTVKVVKQYDSPIQTIDIDKENVIIDLSVNKEIRLVAKTTSNDRQKETKIIWTSSNTKIATVNENGLVTGIANGTTVVTAKTDNGKSQKCVVTVQTSPTGIIIRDTNVTLSDITLDLTDPRVAPKSKDMLIEYVPSTTNVNRDITWSSSDLYIASVVGRGTDNSDAKVTGEKNGNIIITAKTANGKVATCKVKVQTSPTQIKLSQNDIKLDVTDSPTQKLTVTYFPDTTDASKALTWKSDNTGIAIVDKNGLVRGVANGVTTITATTANNVSNTCRVEVHTSPSSIVLKETEILLDSTDAKMAPKSKEIQATIIPSTADVNTNITWTNSDNGVATISGTDNLIRTVTGVKNGTTIVGLKTPNGRTATSKVTVQTSPTQIELNKTNMVLDISGLNAKKEETLTVTYTPSTANANKQITWTSSNPGIATVDTNGKVKGVGNGSATITATTKNGVSKQCLVIVQRSITKITLSKSSTTLDLAEVETTKNIQLTAKIEPSAVTEGYTWSSSNSGVASVDSNGYVSGKSEGTTTITVKSSSGKVSATCTITVKTSIAMKSAQQKYTLKGGTDYQESRTSTCCTLGDCYSYAEDCSGRDSITGQMICHITNTCTSRGPDKCESCTVYDTYFSPGYLVISFTLTTNIDTSKLILKWTGDNKVSMGSLRSEGNGEYYFTLTNNSYDDASGSVNIKYSGNGITKDLYTWTISK